jgi:hypothetical protein
MKMIFHYEGTCTAVMIYYQIFWYILSYHNSLVKLKGKKRELETESINKQARQKQDSVIEQKREGGKNEGNGKKQQKLRP